MIGVTAQQKRVLDFILGFAAINGRVPNYVQIAAGVGYAYRNSAFVKVQELIERGRLVAVRGSPVRLGYVLPDVTIGGDRFRFVPMGWRRLSAGGLTLAYRGPYPIRSGITCADFDRDGQMLRRATAA